VFVVIAIDSRRVRALVATQLLASYDGTSRSSVGEDNINADLRGQR
jgi:hypothetical protein